MEDIRLKFSDPPASFGPTPFWMVNEGMNPAALEKSLKDLKAKGMAGVIIHPRTGLEVEYLSPEFWKGMDFIVETLEKLDLKGWIYDEYNWPSGAAGGILLRAHPEYRQRGLNYRIVKGRASVELAGPLVSAFDPANGMRQIRDQDGLRTFIPPEGARRSLVFFEEPMTDGIFATSCAPWAREEAMMLDYLNPEAVGAFMELTHEEYARRYSRHFGKTILGVFTDEPQNHRGLIWCSDLLNEFRSRAGYDLLPLMHHLAIDSVEAVRTRLDYYRVASQLYKERYFDRVGRWCEERGLIFTGHLSEEDYPSVLPANHGSLFLPLSAMQMPGVDWLGIGYGMSDSATLGEAPNLNPKMLSSVAHVMGRERCLVELWGGGGWEATPAKMKFSLDWMFGCGVNFINPHLAWVSAKGFRKRDFPPSFSKIEPWWERCGVLSKYIARLSRLLTRGAHRARILLLFPTLSMWAAHRGRGDPSAKYDAIIKGLVDTTDILLSHQHDFDYLFEEALDKYKISDGAVTTGIESFDTIVIPPDVVLQNPTAEWLKKAEAAGINIVKQYTIEELVPILDRIAPAAVAVRGPMARRTVALHREIEGLHIFFLANLAPDSGEQTVVLRGMAGKKIEVWNPDNGEIHPCESARKEGDDLIIGHYFEAGSSIIFACDENNKAVVSERRAANVTGVSYKTRVIELGGGWEGNLEGKNLYVVEPWRIECRQRTVRNFTQLRRDRRYGIQARVVIGLGKAIVHALNPIVRPERRYRFERFFNFGASQDRIPTAEKILGVSFDKMGLYEGMECVQGVLDYIPMRIVAGAPFPPPGEVYVMKSTIIIESAPGDLEIVYEDVGEAVSIRVNGVAAPQGAPADVWDECNRVAPIAGLVKTGKNEITFESRMPDFPAKYPCIHAPEIIALRGDFTVSGGAITAGAPKILPGQSWTRQGAPNYLGEVIYRRDIDAPQVNRTAILDLGDVRDVVEARLNDRSVGERLWPPYRFDVAGALVAGANRIEIRVRATAANLFCGRPRDSGLLGIPKLIL